MDGIIRTRRDLIKAIAISAIGPAFAMAIIGDLRHKDKLAFEKAAQLQAEAARPAYVEVCKDVQHRNSPLCYLWTKYARDTGAVDENNTPLPLAVKGLSPEHPLYEGPSGP